MENGLLNIRRKSQAAGRFRKYRIFIDGKLGASVKNGETVSLLLHEGRHEIQARLDWYRSRKLPVEIGTNETVDLECGDHCKGLGFMLAAFYSIVPVHGMSIYVKKTD